ncbi:hypothetical protein KSX_48520 [Ktedonospora formicarum]|uniref:Uncharacterized protein n=1 Tax=Ktedonospora formicarum TaxID=2778364 RepID=A0A8J3I8L9_9CHLR|nr:hypothetical protein KSX_48520 [Ktedonospora formicarum]
MLRFERVYLMLGRNNATRAMGVFAKLNTPIALVALILDDEVATINSEIGPCDKRGLI